LYRLCVPDVQTTLAMLFLIAVPLASVVIAMACAIPTEWFE
jgi:hypothetical protein